jgi:hypothetical protein
MAVRAGEPGARKLDGTEGQELVAEDINICGYVFAVSENVPVMVHFDNGSPQRYLPVFASVNELESFMEQIGTLMYRVKVINYPFDFITGVEELGVIVAANLRRAPEPGKILWTKVTIQ